MNIRGAVWAAIYSLGSLSLLHAQTTWQSDIVIEGDLDVGTTADRGNLRVTGETGGSAGAALRVTGDGGILFNGTYGTGTLPTIPAGPYFLWYPKKSALKVGASYFTDSNIGNLSIGLNGDARGFRSTALNGYAQGDYSFAGGDGYAMGEYSVGIGFGNAYADYAVAIGFLSLAHGVGATSLGYSEADGDSSTAFSYGAAMGQFSVAFGGGDGEIGNSQFSMATGESSIAIGGGSLAHAFSSVVIGAGTADGNPTAWVETDPQFVVGYGTGDYNSPPVVQNRNAFIIYKNGNARFTKRQGDILMGEFGNPE